MWAKSLKKITFKTKQRFSSYKSSSSSLKTKFLVLQLDQTYFYVLYFTYNNSFHIVLVAKKKGVFNQTSLGF